MSIFEGTTEILLAYIILLAYTLGLHLTIKLVIVIPILAAAIQEKALTWKIFAYSVLQLLIGFMLGLLSFIFSLILISLVRWVLGLFGIILEGDMLYAGVYIVLDLIRLFMFRN